MTNPFMAAFKPNTHLMKNRGLEIALGLAFFIIGCVMLYDAFDARGKKMPWPAGAVTPW